MRGRGSNEQTPKLADITAKVMLVISQDDERNPV